MRIVNQLPLGLVSYSQTDTLQREIHTQVDAGAEDALILSQFYPVYTAGRATKPEAIVDKSLPVVNTDRAGSITWHGPGQLVIYPIVKLADPHNSIAYIRAVENGILSGLKNHWHLPLTTIRGRAGIWWQTPGHPDRKICAIGLKIARSATLHGVALNVHPDFSQAFQGIIPCGLQDAWVCSLADFGIQTSITQVAELLVPYLLSSLTPVLARTFDPAGVNWVSVSQKLAEPAG